MPVREVVFSIAGCLISGVRGLPAATWDKQLRLTARERLWSQDFPESATPCSEWRAVGQTLDPGSGIAAMALARHRQEDSLVQTCTGLARPGTSVYDLLLHDSIPWRRLLGAHDAAAGRRFDFSLFHFQQLSGPIEQHRQVVVLTFHTAEMDGQRQYGALVTPCRVNHHLSPRRLRADVFRRQTVEPGFSGFFNISAVVTDKLHHAIWKLQTRQVLFAKTLRRY